MKVVMFVPFANIWVHSALEAALGEDWKLQGADILMVRCSTVFQSACPAIDESSLTTGSPTEDKMRICTKCILRRQNLDSQYGFNSLEIGTYITPADRKDVDLVLSKVRLEAWDTLVVEGLDIGKIAAYEFFLRNKLDSMKIPLVLWPEYKSHLMSALLALKASKRLLESHKPDLVIVHNELYGVNNVVAKTARSMGITVRHLGIGLEVSKYGSSLTLFKDYDSELQLPASELWQKYKAKGQSNLNLESFVSSMRYRAKGQSAFTYSSRSKRRGEIQVRKKLGLFEEKPTILFLTSSTDERFAADLTGTLPESITVKDTKNFKNLEQYLHELIDVFRSNQEIQLIIRIHPRMFPNKRESVRSAAAIRLLDFLSNPPANVIVNWPEQGLSLFEVAQLCNTALNISSSAGLELLSLGIPVGIYEPERLFAYPREFNLPVMSGEAFGQYVRRISSESWDIKHVRNAVFFRMFLTQVVSIDLAGKLPDRKRWTWLRLVNGLDLRTRFPVPQRLLRTLENCEMQRTRRKPPVGLDIAKVADRDFQTLEISEMQSTQKDSYNQDLALALKDIYKATFGLTPLLGRKLLMTGSVSQSGA
jgi:hypothetical protein